MFVPGLVTGDIITNIGPAWTIMLGARFGCSEAIALIWFVLYLRHGGHGNTAKALSGSEGRAGWTRCLCFTRMHSSRATVLLREHWDRVRQLPSCTAVLGDGDIPRFSRGLCGADVSCRLIV